MENDHLCKHTGPKRGERRWSSLFDDSLFRSEPKLPIHSSSRHAIQMIVKTFPVVFLLEFASYLSQTKGEQNEKSIELTKFVDCSISSTTISSKNSSGFTSCRWLNRLNAGRQGIFAERFELCASASFRSVARRQTDRQMKDCSVYSDTEICKCQFTDAASPPGGRGLHGSPSVYRIRCAADGRSHSPKRERELWQSLPQCCPQGNVIAQPTLPAFTLRSCEKTRCASTLPARRSWRSYRASMDSTQMSAFTVCCYLPGHRSLILHWYMIRSQPRSCHSFRLKLFAWTLEWMMWGATFIKKQPEHEVASFNTNDQCELQNTKAEYCPAMTIDTLTPFKSCVVHTWWSPFNCLKVV